MNYEKLIKEISHKQRSIKELISYIKTKSDESRPNYSLLLGSGASITSGIRSGQQLVSEWRSDFYTKLAKKPYSTDDEAIKFLTTNEGTWYNPSNEYSSLFERKFDLPPQRRRFVENEVDEAFPSIGYSYLVSLASESSKYFDTIYTTNFDDLINESFYQFSKRRPMVCAHDSSVNSLSISSARPKIIKLHGDYLFDDIKSTLKETESLESNIKNKLTHFSKEYGLIVVGYAGNDRSVMDIINHLLKSEDYFKNGIYWCLRKGETINQELRKLLWKDKVYYVEIDGFDEFFAEVHHEIKGNLALQDSFNDSKKENIINSFTVDSFGLKERSSKIREDIEHLVQHKNEFDTANILRELIVKPRNEEESFESQADFKEILEIDTLIYRDKYDEAERVLENKIKNIDSTRKKIKFIMRLIDTKVELKKLEQALNLAQELMNSDPFNLNFVFKKLSLIKNDLDACNFLAEIEENFTNAFQYLNVKAEKALIEFKRNPKRPFMALEEIRNLLDKSLSLNSGLDNTAWLKSIEVLNEIYKDSKSNNDEQSYRVCADKLIDKALKINSCHLTSFEMFSNLYQPLTDFELVENQLDELMVIYDRSSIAKKNEIVEIMFGMLSFDTEYKSKERLVTFLEKFLDSQFFTKTKELNNAALPILSANYQLSKLRERASSTAYMTEAMKSDNSPDFARWIVDHFCKVEKTPDTALEFVKSKRKYIETLKYHEMLSDIYLALEDYDSALKELELAFPLDLLNINYLRSKSFILLRGKRFQEINDLELVVSKLHTSESEKNVFTINFSAARKMDGKIFNEVELRNIVGKSTESSFKICAAALLEDGKLVNRILKSTLSYDFSKLYEYQSWPAIESQYLDSYQNSVEVIKTDAA